jgi:hypothetical protein
MLALVGRAEGDGEADCDEVVVELAPVEDVIVVDADGWGLMLGVVIDGVIADWSWQGY